MHTPGIGPSVLEPVELAVHILRRRRAHSDEGARDAAHAVSIGWARMPPSVEILRLITRLNVGGPARHALLLTRGLRPEYRTVLAAGRPGVNEGELLDPEVEVRRVPLVRELSAPTDVRALDAVRKLMIAQRPAIVHTHTAKAGSIGRLAAMSLRRRPLTVHTFHGHVLRGYFGRPTQRAIVAAETWLAGHTDLLIAVSEEVRDELLALGVGDRHRFEVVPLGLDLESFLRLNGRSGLLRERLQIDDRTPLLGIVGRLVPVKDHATMLRALALLPGVHLAVLGDGDQRDLLEALAHDLGVGKRVHFTGWWHDVPGAVSDLDVVVLSSRNEGTPVALIEASAGARPVVATDVGGVPSVVEDGVTGRLVPAGDHAAIALRVSELLDNEEMARRLGVAGRERVRRTFAADRLLGDMRELYGDLLERRHVSSRRHRSRGP